MIRFFIAFVFCQILHAEDIQFQILHTNDLHSHFEGAYKKNGEHIDRMGGFDRLVFEINSRREAATRLKQTTIVLDAGDFFAGTVFHALGPSEKYPSFPEWEYFKAAGYDVVTLGNHEFDAKNLGVMRMFAKRQDGPVLVSTNIKQGERNIIEGVQEYASLSVKGESQDIKVAVLGLLGPDGCLVSRGTRESVSFLGFDDKSSKEKWSELLDHLQDRITHVRKTHDLVVLIMHAGAPEDEKFATKLDGIDLIIAGHTHKKYGRVVNGVMISQAGSFGESLGHIRLSYNTESKILRAKDDVNQWIQPIRFEGDRDQFFQNRIIEFRKNAEQEFSEKMRPLNQIVFRPQFDMLHAREVGNALGQFITSGIYQEIHQSFDPQLDVYFTSMGLIRSSFYKNIDYTKADIFEFLSVGFDEHSRPGASLSFFYLTASEVETVISFMELYSNFSNSFAPAFSDSLEFKVRRYGIPFVNRIYDIKLHGKPLKDYDRLIKVGTNMFVASQVDLLPNKTYGLLSIQPKNSEGESVKPEKSTEFKEYEWLVDFLKRSHY